MEGARGAGVAWVSMIDLTSKNATKDLKALAKSKPADLPETLAAALAQPKLVATALDVAQRTKVKLPLEALAVPMSSKLSPEEAQTLAAVAAPLVEGPADVKRLVDVLVGMSLATFWKSSAAVGFSLRAAKPAAVTDVLLEIGWGALGKGPKPKDAELLDRTFWTLRGRPRHLGAVALARAARDVTDQALSTLFDHVEVTDAADLEAMFLDATKQQKILPFLSRRPDLLLAWGESWSDAIAKGTPEGTACVEALARRPNELKLADGWGAIFARAIVEAPAPVAAQMADVADWSSSSVAAKTQVSTALLERARRGELIKELLWDLRNPFAPSIPVLVDLLAGEHAEAALDRLASQPKGPALAALRALEETGKGVHPSIAERLGATIASLTPPPKRIVADADLDGSVLFHAITSCDVELVTRALAAGVGPADAAFSQVPGLVVALHAWGENEHGAMLEIIRSLVAAGFDPRQKLAWKLDDEDGMYSWNKGESPISRTEALRESFHGVLWMGEELREARHVEELLAALGASR